MDNYYGPKNDTGFNRRDESQNINIHELSGERVVAAMNNYPYSDDPYYANHYEYDYKKQHESGIDSHREDDPRKSVNNIDFVTETALDFIGKTILNPNSTSQGLNYTVGDTSANILSSINGKIISGNANWFIKKLRPYFQVTTHYVLKKIKLITFPLNRHNWRRIKIIHGYSDFYGLSNERLDYNYSNPSNINDATDSKSKIPFALPKDDLNSPDLYLPVMAFTTYVLLLGIKSGLEGKFKPEILGLIASSALMITIAEVVFIKTGFYLLNLGNDIVIMDLISYIGYNYVSLVFVCLVSTFSVNFWLINGCWMYFTLCFILFFLRSVKSSLFPDIDPSSLSGIVGYSDDSGNRKSKVYFLLVIAILHFVLSYFSAK